MVHRYKIWSVHYVSPTDDNRYQAQKMSTHGLFSDVHYEVGDVIVADVSVDGVKANRNGWRIDYLGMNTPV